LLVLVANLKICLKPKELDCGTINWEKQGKLKNLFLSVGGTRVVGYKLCVDFADVLVC